MPVELCVFAYSQNRFYRKLCTLTEHPIDFLMSFSSIPELMAANISQSRNSREVLQSHINN